MMDLFTKEHERTRKESLLVLGDEVYAIIGAALTVRKELGVGFLEAVYQEALAIEFQHQGIPFSSQPPLTIHYKGQALRKEYVADFLCHEKIIVEIKAISKLSGNELAQLLNYLKATGLKVGVLINFGSMGELEWKRVVV
jgi:GxxExxY protein